MRQDSHVLGAVAQGGSLSACKDPSVSATLSALLVPLMDQFSMMKRLVALRTFGML
jgi:hypothetical protein